MRSRFSILLESTATPTPASPPRARPGSPNTAFIAARAGGVTHPDAAGAYRDGSQQSADDATVERDEPAPEPTPVTDETGDVALEELKARRRRFALANHPDLASEEDRADATRRMAEANRMFDEAIRERG